MGQPVSSVLNPERCNSGWETSRDGPKLKSFHNYYFLLTSGTYEHTFRVWVDSARHAKLYWADISATSLEHLKTKYQFRPSRIGRLSAEYSTEPIVNFSFRYVEKKESTDPKWFASFPPVYSPGRLQRGHLALNYEEVQEWKKVIEPMVRGSGPMVVDYLGYFMSAELHEVVMLPSEKTHNVHLGSHYSALDARGARFAYASFLVSPCPAQGKLPAKGTVELISCMFW